MARAAVRGRLSWRVATLVETRDETPSARTLELRVEGWPGHLAGQHVDVRLTAEDGYSTQRSYSIASAPSADMFELTVQILDDGEVSPFLARDFAVGDPIEIRGPVGGWFVWRAEERDPLLLVAGGSGIVPLMAIVRARAAASSRVPCRLIYSVRTPDEVYYAHELARRVRDDGGFDLALLYTRSAPEHSPRVPGRLGADDLVRHGWPADFDPRCFVCGPTGFVETVSELLVDAGHESRQIRTERFG